MLAAAQGHDPAGKRYSKRRETTIAELIKQFEKEGTDHLKERNRGYMLARINHHIVPLLGRKKVSEVRIGDVEQMMRDVKAGKTAKDRKTGSRARMIVTGGQGAATRAVRDLSSRFTFAIRQELATSNPCSAVKKAPDQRRTRYLSIEEIIRLGQALASQEAQGANAKAIAIMRLWAMTGCRRDEIAGLMWSEIDVDRACLVLADSKTGHSVRPLANAAITILKAQTDARRKQRFRLSLG